MGRLFGIGLSRAGLIALIALVGSVALATVAYSDESSDPMEPIMHRGDRYVPQPAGTKSSYTFWFGPYTVPQGHDLNRIDVDVPLANGLVTWIEPHIVRASDLQELPHQDIHIHHSHWFALDPGNKEDNYFGQNAEWVFGNGDEETRANFELRSAADRKGPIYGQHIGGKPQLMIYMIHNKTSQPQVAYIKLRVHFIHGTIEQLNALGARPYHDTHGVLFGRTYDVPRRPNGRGVYESARDDKRGPIEWESTVSGTMIGTGGHVHPGGLRVVVENYGSEERPCRDDGRGYGGTLLLTSDAIGRDSPYSEDFQMEVTDPRWRAPIRKGDRIRISGTYENKRHAWYEVMTHEGIYIDTQQKPRRGCAPYLVGQSRKSPRGVRLPKATGFPGFHFRRDSAPPEGWPLAGDRRSQRAGARRWIDPTEGTLNRRFGHGLDEFCGKRWGGGSCERSLPARQARGGVFSDRVDIVNFLYRPGDRAMSGAEGAPVRIKKGSSLTFYNEDALAGIRHTVTTCRWPCNGGYVANYPKADGVWDSGMLSLSLDPVAEQIGAPRLTASTPRKLAVGKYAYFCRIHPWMRGAFQVVR